MRALRLLGVCLISICLWGCAGIGTKASSDTSADKLRNAEDLYERQNRPLIAERQIYAVLDAVRHNNDQLGMAEAYRAYAFFLRSDTLAKWRQHYRQEGFLDPVVSFETRYEKSIDYLEKARVIFQQHRRYDALTIVNLNIGFTFEVLGNLDAACHAFNRSLGNNRDSLEEDAMKVALPKGYATYEAFLAQHWNRAQCGTSRKQPARPRRFMSA